MLDLYNLKETLADGVATVTFEKIDGSLREMRCTTNPDLMPKQLLREEGNTRTTPDGLMVVYDLDLGEYRSFRLDRVKSVIKE